MGVRSISIRHLAMLLGATALATVALPAAAKERALTPAETAAGERLDTALQAKDYATARTILTAPDLAQVAYAHVLLYQLYSQGLGGPKDEAAAAKALRRAAELGDLSAMLTLAKTLQATATRASLTEAKGWFAQAADQGVDSARTQLGVIQWGEQNYTGAVANWTRSVADPYARACLGAAHFFGIGTRADRLLADYHFFKLVGSARGETAACVEGAAASGNSWAQYVAGIWFADKKSSAYDPARAVKLLTAASEQRHARAAGMLAEMLDKGDGVPRDANWANTHYMRAVEGGETDYYARLGDMALKGDGVERSVANAITYYGKDTSGARAYRLGLIYAGGEGWPRDLPKAIKAMRDANGDEEMLAAAWLKQLADSGNAQGQFAYAQTIEYYRPETDAAGRELTRAERDAAEEKSREESMKYLRRAAQQKLPEAAVALEFKGDLSDAERVRLIRGAADAGYGPAMLKLAYWHIMGGYGFAQDEAAQRVWEERAARTGDKYVLNGLGEQYAMAGAIAYNSIGSDPSAQSQSQQDYALARRYYEAAYAAGYKGAARQLASLYNGAQHPTLNNAALDLKWHRLAVSADARDNDMTAMSDLYEKGRGTAVDLTKAWFWAKLANRTSRQPNPRVDKLWQQLAPDQKTAGERLMMACEMKRYRGCTA